MKKTLSIVVAVSMLVASPLAMAATSSHPSRATGHRLAQSTTPHRSGAPSHAATTPARANGTSHATTPAGHAGAARRVH